MLLSIATKKERNLARQMLSHEIFRACQIRHDVAILEHNLYYLIAMTSDGKVLAVRIAAKEKTQPLDNFAIMVQLFGGRFFDARSAHDLTSYIDSLGLTDIQNKGILHA